MDDVVGIATGNMIGQLTEMRALHEELKAQVAELQKAHKWAEALLAQYSDLYDFSCISYFTLDRAAMIREVTQSGASLLAADHGRLPGRSFTDFVEQSSRLDFVRYLASVFNKHKNRQIEIEMIDENGDTLAAAIEGKIVHNSKECRLALTDISVQKRKEEELRILTIFDPLTGLHNRAFFQEEMSRLEGGRVSPISVMMADVDNLKQVNDGSGHAAGDALLRRVGHLLRSAFRTEDVVARIGGDEFAILLPESDESAARRAASRVEKLLDQDNNRHRMSPISLSLGRSTAVTGSSLADALKEADGRMYETKFQVKETTRPMSSSPLL